MTSPLMRSAGGGVKQVWIALIGAALACPVPCHSSSLLLSMFFIVLSILELMSFFFSVFGSIFNLRIGSASRESLLLQQGSIFSYNQHLNFLWCT